MLGQIIPPFLGVGFKCQRPMSTVLLLGKWDVEMLPYMPQQAPFLTQALLVIVLFMGRGNVDMLPYMLQQAPFLTRLLLVIVLFLGKWDVEMLLCMVRVPLVGIFRHTPAPPAEPSPAQLA